MSRIESCFNQLKKTNQKALIPFITAGDPTLDVTVELMHQLVEAGANILELGLPFSDPMADGPVIQRAIERSLAQGTNTDDVFNVVQTFRKQNKSTPVILMGYLNPIEAMGYKTFANKASQSGVDGCLVVDLPAEESEPFIAAMKPYHLDQIFLVSPTTSVKRLDYICEVASGFLYYVSLKGVTGSDQFNIEIVSKKMAQIRETTALPLGIGFGIKTPELAKVAGRISDAVIVGSALVERIAEHADNIEKMKQEVYLFVQSLRLALDNV